MYSINSTVLYKYNIMITLVEYSFDSKYYFDEYFQKFRVKGHYKIVL